MITWWHRICISQMLLKCLHIFGNAYCVRERTKFCIGNFIFSRLYTVCIIHSRVSVCVFQSENKTDIVHNQHAIYYITNFLVNLFHPLDVLLLCMVVKWGETVTIFPIWDSITTYSCIHITHVGGERARDIRFIIHTFTYIIQHSHSIQRTKNPLEQKPFGMHTHPHPHCSIFCILAISIHTGKYMLPRQNINSASWWHFGIQIFCSFSDSFNSRYSNKLNSRCGSSPCCCSCWCIAKSK